MGEANAWRNSLTRMCLVVQDAGLTDHGVALEYQLPLTSARLDCMLTGRDREGNPHAVIVELKQWQACEPSEGERVVTWVGGGHRRVLHPSVQSNQYRLYLLDGHEAFYGADPILLDSCAYLHNYRISPTDPLMLPRYAPFMRYAPVFGEEDSGRLRDYLVRHLERGDGLPILERVRESRYRPSKKLMDNVSATIREKNQYVLLDEQVVVYDQVRALAERAFASGGKQAVIVRGGPGTGKSVIAVNLMADLLRAGKTTHYATGSKAFTETLRHIIGARGSQLVRYFNSYAGAEKDEIDVLVMDEAHRIRETSSNRFTPAAKRTGKHQLDELFDVSRLAVFFIDDDQVVRPNEIGSVDYIKETAARRGISVQEYQLEAQFRCGGLDAFVGWVDNTLDIRTTANALWEGNEGFDFRIVDSPAEAESLVRARVKDGATGRMVAGFCWPWSNPNADGSLVDDVVIGDFHRPWNAKPEARRLKSGIPSASLWATEPGGIDQIGCIYTAQGFEFDYAGVLWGKDLTYDQSAQAWKSNTKASYDNVVKRSKEEFLKLLKSTYRVLLSRGLKGCYVFIEDDGTRNFVLNRMRRKS